MTKEQPKKFTPHRHANVGLVRGLISRKLIQLINSFNWSFAKTMPQIPHEYIVVEDYPEKSEEINAFIAEIDAYNR